MTAPILRFKDQGRSYPDWVEKKLKDCVTFSKGGSLSKSDLSPHGATPCLLYGELYTTYGEVTKAVINKTDSTEDLVKSQMNDVILPMSGETAEDIAKATCIKQEGVAYGGDLMVLRSKSLDGCFLSYSLNSVNRRQISRIAQGKTVVHINPSRVSDISINIACLEEQQKIAAFFTALDEKIKIYSQKIDYLHNLKKGVVKKLFSEISSGEEFILGDLVGRISSGKTKNVKDNIGKYPLCGSTGVIGCCRHHEYSGEKILIARVGANAGTVNFHYGDCGVTDNTLVISSCKSTVSLKWLFHFLTFKNLTKMVFGSGQPLITASQLKNISVPVPSIECQIVVVNTLDTMDKAVEIASKKLDCLQSFKKAFMQQMFV